MVKQGVTYEDRSLIKTTNKSGPSMLPWVAPERTGTILDRVSLIRIHCLLDPT